MSSEDEIPFEKTPVKHRQPDNIAEEEENVISSDESNNIIEEIQQLNPQLTQDSNQSIPIYNEPDSFLELLNQIQSIIKQQLHILDSIYRVKQKNLDLEEVWRYQINILDANKRHELYSLLKELKQTVNRLYQFKNGLAQYLIHKKDTFPENIINKLAEFLLAMKFDLEKVEISQINNIGLNNFSAFTKSQEFLKENHQLWMIVFQYVIRTMNLENFQDKQLIICQLCTQELKSFSEYLEHQKCQHLEFLAFFDASRVKCFDTKQCKQIRYRTATKNYDFKEHMLEHHSVMFKIEKPFVSLLGMGLNYYKDKNRSQKISQDLQNTVKKIGEEQLFQFKQFEQNYKGRGDTKYRAYAHFIQQMVSQVEGGVDQTQLQTLEKMTIFLKTTWILYCNFDGRNQDSRGLPKNMEQIVSPSQVYGLAYQVKLLDALCQQSQLYFIRNCLLLGIYNNYRFMNDFATKIEDLNTFTMELGKFEMFASKQKILPNECIFNGPLCNKTFKSCEEAYVHYFTGHIAIAYCLSSSNCKLDLNQPLDKIMEHCIDNHKQDFITLAKKYLKKQKLFYQYKAVCVWCKINLDSRTEIYWRSSECFKNDVEEFQPIVLFQWQDIFNQHTPYLIENGKYNSVLTKQYLELMEKNLRQLKSQVVYKDLKKFAVCKRCYDDKPAKFSHLKEEQFKAQSECKLIPLAKIQGNIKYKLGNTQTLTYPELQGNIFGYRCKALLIVEGTSIIYGMKSDQAKLREKFVLMGSNEQEREAWVNACINHKFLSNHTYQLISMSNQLIRQQEQILKLNKKLWKHFLKRQGITKAQDKLQAEFNKLQDMMLFDSIMHQEQLMFVKKTVKKFLEKCNDKFEQEFLDILESENIFLLEEKLKIKQFAINFKEEPLNIKCFWFIVILAFIYCEKIDDAITGQVDHRLAFNNLIDIVLIPTQGNPFYYWIRQFSQFECNLLFQYSCHPLYLGVFVQMIVVNSARTIHWTPIQKQILNSIFIVLANRSIDVCLPNHYYTQPKKEEKQFQDKKQEYKEKNLLLQYNLLDLLDDHQFIDMTCRIALIKQGFKNMDSDQIYVQSDIRWCMQIGQMFLSSLKAKSKFYEQGIDRNTVTEHLKKMQGLKAEVNSFFGQNVPFNQFDYLTTEYRDLLLDTLTQELQDGDIKDQKTTFLESRKLYIVYFIPVEQKFQNMIQCHTTLRELLYKEPYYSLSNFRNITQFHKEVEYALFPELYPNAEGGLIAKAPDVKKCQLVIDVLQQERDQSAFALQNLAEIRKRKQEDLQQEIQRATQSAPSEIIVNLQLSDFTIRNMEGKPQHKVASKAIFSLVDDQFEAGNSSMAYVYTMQKMSMLQYKQAQLLAEENKNTEFKLQNVIDLKLYSLNDQLQQTVAEAHVSRNLDFYLKQNQQQWDNEQKQFKTKLKSEVKKQQRENQSKEQVENFILQQNKLFLDNKITQLAKNEEIQAIVKNISKYRSICFNSSSSVTSNSPSSSENQSSKREQVLNQIHIHTKQIVQEIQNQSDLLIVRNKLTKEQKKQLIQEMEEYKYFERHSINLSEDTKFRLNASFTTDFQQHIRWIFWRYFEWLKQEFYCYQLIVNHEKGINLVNNQGQLEAFNSIPPLRGSDTYFRDEYRKLRTFQFYQGSPLLFLTITFFEYDEKTFKIMRGLNYGDLLDQEETQKLRKSINNQEVQRMAFKLVKYSTILMRNFKKIILNNFKKNKNPDFYFECYENGIFGKCKGLATRIEFQERGTIHYHMFVFSFQELEQECLFSEKYLRYIKGMITNQYNADQIKKFDLVHRCSTKKCLKTSDITCRDGFPFEETEGNIKQNYPIEILPRRTKEEANIIFYNNDIVRYFNSNCQIKLTNDENVLSYLTKYINKQTKKVQQQEEKKVNKIMELIHKTFLNKATPLQEAYLAFLSQPFVDTSFRTLKIQQHPLKFQSQNDLLECLDDSDRINEKLQISENSNPWYRYLNRPEQFELLNFVEFHQVTINYGKKKKYLDKLNQESQKSLNLIQRVYFIDKNMNIIKIKEKNIVEQICIQTSKLYYQEEYEGPDNCFFLLMLQLYWPHRQESWIDQTQDEYTGYKKTYLSLVDTYDYPRVCELSVENLFRQRFAKFDSYPIRKYVEIYKTLNKNQIRMIESLQQINMNVKFKKNKSLPIQQIDFKKDLLIIITQQLENELSYDRKDKILSILNSLQHKSIAEQQDIFLLLKEEIKSDINLKWDKFNQKIKNILSNIALLYKYSGDEELSNLCFSEINQKTIGKALSQSQEINDEYLSRPVSYRKQLTIGEYVDSQIQKVDSIEINLTSNLLENWQKCNDQQRLALLIAFNSLQKSQISKENFEGVFVHGSGGVGKSYILGMLTEYIQCQNLNCVVLCPTQQAVQNLKLSCSSTVDIMTIHTFFKLEPKQDLNMHMFYLRSFLKKYGVEQWDQTTEIYKYIADYKMLKSQDNFINSFININCLIIEEISMMNPMFLTLLDIYAQITRKSALPFGGIQILAFGDSYQLQPVQQDSQKYYFESHVFKSVYFVHCVELTESIRQKDDQEYYEKILQPIRIGVFEKSQDYQIQIQKLKNRTINMVIMPREALLKEQLDEKKRFQQVINLFFKNEQVNQENERRAKQVISNMESHNKKGFEKWRQFIQVPFQLSISNKLNNEEKIGLALGKDYLFNESSEDNFGYYMHFLLLPLCLRNVLINRISPIIYQNQEEFKLRFNKSICQKEITLFNDAEIIIRKNINKQQKLINGQWAKVKQIFFDIDFNSQEKLKQAQQQITNYLNDNIINNEIQKKIRPQRQSFEFGNIEKLDLQQHLSKAKANNINCLVEKDIFYTEKANLLQLGIQPRVQRIDLKIDNEIVQLEYGDRKFIQEASIEKKLIISLLDELKQQLELINKFTQTIAPRPISKYEKGKRLYTFLKNNCMLELFGFEILQGEIHIVDIQQSLKNMILLIQKLPDVFCVELHQIPINLGYARTIHTAQGATFENIVLDLDIQNAKHQGLLYTALSRVRRLENLYFTGKFDEDIFKVKCDQQIVKFCQMTFLEANRYLENKELRRLSKQGLQEVVKNVKEYANLIRNTLIQMNQLKKFNNEKF